MSPQQTQSAQELFARALLVEDEAHLAGALRIAIRKLGIPVRHAMTLGQARELFRQEEPDFILLDRQLPDGDGLSLCAELRDSGYEGTILVLTAAGQTADRVEGLEQGADDYLGKPFSWEELSARIRALARRNRGVRVVPGSASTVPQLWSRDENRLRILGPHGWIELTPLEFKLASHLMQADGTIVSREELLKEVWGFTLLPKTRTVDHFLGRLRKAFERDPEQPRHFITVRGAGYRFQK